MDNDYELIYLIKIKKSEHALEYLMSKYVPLIYRLIRIYQVNEDDKDDFLQEGLLIVYNSIFRFDERVGSPFYSYVKLVLQRRFLRVLQEKREYESYLPLEEALYSDSESIYDLYIIRRIFNDFYESLTSQTERLVFKMTFIEIRKPMDIAFELGLTSKQVSNIVFKLKDRLKRFI